MKARITYDGGLVVSAETELEAFALRIYAERWCAWIRQYEGESALPAPLITLDHGWQQPGADQQGGGHAG